MTAGVALRGRLASERCMLRHDPGKVANMAGVMKALRASVQAMLFAVAAAGASSTLAQE
jgi:hypothetical protein